MTSFISYKKQIKDIITKLVSSSILHAKWLNTLSFLENCGARKIAACEHPTLVKEQMLKHAQEEFRHAYYLKRQIAKVYHDPMDTYSLEFMLGGTATLHYLTALEVEVVRYLKKINLSREIAYILVTYAIECRAQELYPIYEEILRKQNSPVAVKSIVLEETEHLNEMKDALFSIPSGSIHAEYALVIEAKLCKNWINSINKLKFK